MAYVEPEEFRRIIQRRGITQSGFAEQTRVSKQFVSQLVKGESAPSWHYAFFVAFLCRRWALDDIAATIERRLQL